jgi:hypothetical protein
VPRILLPSLLRTLPSLGFGVQSCFSYSDEGTTPNPNPYQHTCNNHIAFAFFENVK